MKRVEMNYDNYGCMLENILKIEKKLNLNYSTKSKFRKNVYKCEGEETNKIVTNLINMTTEKEELLKNTEFLLNYPQEGLMSKIYPMPTGNVKLPYRPGEKQYKKYKKQIKTKKGKKLITVDSLNTVSYQPKIKSKRNRKRDMTPLLFQ